MPTVDDARWPIYPLAMARFALLSVSDKSGLVELASALVDSGLTLLSTGGTQRVLQEAGIPVTAVEAFTGSPEVMDGRVKTLHPKIHGGLLGREGTDDNDLARIDGAYIDVVVVNLYPFAQTLARPDATFDELIENIDIGGPSMLRSAAKNHHRVTVICDPTDYATISDELKSGAISKDTRRRLAAKAFAHTTAYDAAISGWLSGQDEASDHPKYLTLPFEKAYDLRYGENPHQTGAFYRDTACQAGSLAAAQSLGAGAKELSFNNLVDADAALEAVREFSGPAAVVVKHASPCGIATAETLPAAYHAAREADAMSAFGGIVALNRPVDDATANLIAETFIECVIAPSFDDAALQRLHKKKALRLLATGEWLTGDYAARQFKRIAGGLAVHDRDATCEGEVRSGRVATKRTPTPDEYRALEFAWAACKHVRSNAITLARVGDVAVHTVGIGGGQTARVSAVEGAVKRAGDEARGAVLASDAFFPFPDGLEAAATAGVTAVVQPGGSKGDDKVIAAADAAGIAMVFTGIRHFKH